MSSKLIRLGGMAAVLSGALLIVSELLYLVVGIGQPSAEAASSGSFVVQGLLFLGAGVLLLGGLIGLYASHLEDMGTLGLAGFLVALVGTALTVGALWDSAFVLPALAQEAPDLVEAEPPTLVFLGSIVSFGLFALGWLLFGVAMLRSRTYPRVAAILLIVGAVLAFFPLPFSTVVFGAAVAWMGLNLLSGKGAPTPQRERVA